MIVTSQNSAHDIAAISAYGKARSTVKGTPLSETELQKMHAYWQACCYLAAGMIYLRANPLLREPFQLEHIKSRLLGHWGTSPGLSFIYIHLNRLIKKYDLDMIFVAGQLLVHTRANKSEHCGEKINQEFPLLRQLQKQKLQE